MYMCYMFEYIYADLLVFCGFSSVLPWSTFWGQGVGKWTLEFLEASNLWGYVAAGAFFVGGTYFVGPTFSRIFRFPEI